MAIFSGPFETASESLTRGSDGAIKVRKLDSFLVGLKYSVVACIEEILGHGRHNRCIER